jgi:LacI family transcriptional regulator
MTTLRDLSRHLGLSVTQVSRALNGHDDVAEDTRARVVEAARRFRYRPNVSARRLVTGRSGMLGLVLPDVPRPEEEGQFVQIVGGLSQQLSRLGRQFVLHIADPEDDALDAYRRLTSGGAIDGFVLLDPELRDRRARFLRDAGVPFVIHGRIEGPEFYPFYDIDNEAVGRRLTEVLLAAGHRRIAVLNGPRGRTYVEARRRGHLAALAAQGLVPEPDLHRFGPMTEAEGHLAALALWGRGRRATAVLCGSMRLAHGVMRTLAALGLRVPGDVSVVAHDDALPGLGPEGFEPRLVATRSPLAEGWPHLARMLAAALDGAPVASLQRIGEVTLTEGGSVAAPPAGPGGGFGGSLVSTRR